MSNGANYSKPGNGHDRDDWRAAGRMGQRQERYDEERERRDRPWNPTDPRDHPARDLYGHEEEQRGDLREGRRRGREDEPMYERPRHGDDRFNREEGPRHPRIGFGGGQGEREMFDRERGGHRGKGPRNYRRSDERIREDVCQRLTDDDLLDASNIEVEVTNGEVLLSGEVDRREAKRRAEDIAEQCSGVNDVQNNIRVAAR